MQKLLYLFIILFYTAIGWLLYFYVSKSREELHFNEMKYQQRLKSNADKEKLDKIKEIDRNI